MLFEVVKIRAISDASGTSDLSGVTASEQLGHHRVVRRFAGACREENDSSYAASESAHLKRFATTFATSITVTGVSANNAIRNHVGPRFVATSKTG